MNGDTTAIALSLELAALGELRDWPPCAQRVEALVEAMRGGDGVSQRDIDTLRAWRQRWVAVSPQVRAFYRDALRSPREGMEHAALNCAVARIVGLRQYAEPVWVRGTIARMYEADTGRPPAVDLIPAPR